LRRPGTRTSWVTLKPQTLKPQSPKTLQSRASRPKTSALNPRPEVNVSISQIQTLNPESSMPAPQSSSLTPQPSALKPESSALKPEPSALKSKPYTYFSGGFHAVGALGAIFLMSSSLGFVASSGSAFAINKVESDEKEIAGQVMAVSLALGSATGALLALPLSKLVLF